MCLAWNGKQYTYPTSSKDLQGTIFKKKSLIADSCSPGEWKWPYLLGLHRLTERTHPLYYYCLRDKWVFFSLAFWDSKCAHELTGMCICEGQMLTSDAFLKYSPPCVLRQYLSLNLELTLWTILAGPGISRLLYLAPSIGTISTRCHAFCRSLNLGPPSFTQQTLSPLSHLLGPLNHLLICKCSSSSSDFIEWAKPTGWSSVLRGTNGC